MTSAYLDDAAAAVDVLTTRWFTANTPSVWVPDDYWKTPTIAAELATFMRLADNTVHLDICDAAIAAGWCCYTTSGWLDDATTWGRFAVSVHAWLAAIGSSDAPSYLDVATTVGDDLQQQWADTSDACDGGLYWMRDPSAQNNFKSSISTLGLMEIAVGRHFVDDSDGTQLAWAQKAWDWIAAKGLVDEDGLVWGGLLADCTIDPVDVPVPALQGNALGPLWSLFRATGDDALLDAAQRIVDGTLVKFTWPGTSVLNTAQDAEWASQPLSWRISHVNPTLSKGIFTAFLGDLTVNLATVPGRAAAASRYANALRDNAQALRANYPKGIYGMDWHTADPDYEGEGDDMLDACLQYSAIAAFDAAASVDAIS
jgi:hypothetical protein